MVLTFHSRIIFKILLALRDEVSLFYKLCDQVAILDMLQSLAATSMNPFYIRPKFGDHLDIQYGKHPLLDFLCSREPVTNSVVSKLYYLFIDGKYRNLLTLWLGLIIETHHLLTWANELTVDKSDLSLGFM